MLRKIAAVLALMLVLTGIGVVVHQEQAEAKFPLRCYRMATSRPYTYATICNGLMRRLEERLPDGTVRVIWPITTTP